jgi:hypothetical protein
VILDIVAEYITEGDTLIGTAYVMDELTEVFHPEEVRYGEAFLTFLNNPITKAIKFDRRMGNSNGDFKFTFSHPPRTKNIHFQVNVTLMDNTSYTKTVGILVEGPTGIPLIENAPEGTDFRSRKRVAEGL